MACYSDAQVKRWSMQLQGNKKLSRLVVGFVLLMLGFLYLVDIAFGLRLLFGM